jgi:hypothetical protein
MNTQNQSVNTDVKRRGRPAVKVEWPDGHFTVKDLASTVSTPLSNVSIQLKINTAVRSGALRVVGKSTPKAGRPRVLYSKAQSTQQGSFLQS